MTLVPPSPPSSALLPVCAQGHPSAGSAIGDHLTEAAYAASHRIQEATHSARDKLSAAVSSNSAPTTATSETK
jgi:hypothetical protein